MADKLKACPFCGGEPLSKWRGCSIDGSGHWGIGCCISYAQGDDMEDAMASWNTRSDQVGVPTVQAGDDYGINIAVAMKNLCADIARKHQDPSEIDIAHIIEHIDCYECAQSAAPSQSSKDGVDELILSLRSKKNGKLPRGVADKLLSILNTKTPSQPVADHTEQHLAMVPSNEQIIEQCKAAGIDWLTPDEEVGKFPGSFDMASMRQMRALLTTANAGKDAIPAYTTGHCEYHKQPGGCQQHNLHCGWPTCDQKKVKP